MNITYVRNFKLFYKTIEIGNLFIRCIVIIKTIFNLSVNKTLSLKEKKFYLNWCCEF